MNFQDYFRKNSGIFSAMAVFTALMVFVSAQKEPSHQQTFLAFSGFFISFVLICYLLNEIRALDSTWLWLIYLGYNLLFVASLLYGLNFFAGFFKGTLSVFVLVIIVIFYGYVTLKLLFFDTIIKIILRLKSGKIKMNRLQELANRAQALNIIDGELGWIAQGLGHIDEDLRNTFSQRSIKRNSTDPFWFAKFVTLSRLWTMGTYECLRTLDERARLRKDLFSKEDLYKIRQTKEFFARVRMPLAKLKPANKHKETDYSSVQGFFTSSKGIEWIVAKNITISMPELSEAFFNLLGSLRDCLRKTGDFRANLN